MQIYTLWNLPSQLGQGSLHCVVALPVRKACKLWRVDLGHQLAPPTFHGAWNSTDFAIILHTRKVDLISELDSWWNIGIVLSTMHGKRVDAILMNALSVPPLLVQSQYILISTSRNIRVEDRESCHSSWTCISRRRPSDHKSKRL